MNKKVTLWYKEMGYRDNPFSIKPGVINDRLLGHAQVVDQISDCIKKEQPCLVHGKFGVGKTTFLKSVIRRFAGKRKVIYFSCNRLLGSLDIDKLLHERFGIVGKLLKIKSKKMILLLDEADHLSKADFARVLKYYNNGYFQSIVIVTHNLPGLTLSPGVAKLVKKHTYELSQISEEEAIALARQRIGDTTFISDTMFKRIFEKAESSRMFLQQCEDVCRVAYNKNHKRVTVRDIKLALA